MLMLETPNKLHQIYNWNYIYIKYNNEKRGFYSFKKQKGCREIERGMYSNSNKD